MVVGETLEAKEAAEKLRELAAELGRPYDGPREAEKSQKAIHSTAKSQEMLGGDLVEEIPMCLMYAWCTVRIV